MKAKRKSAAGETPRSKHLLALHDTIESLRYITKSPLPEHGGFHPHAVLTAKSALHHIALLRRSANAPAEARRSRSQPAADGRTGRPLVLRALSAGFELGDGKWEGSQMIGGRWWVPKYGCDSLENMIDCLQFELEHNVPVRRAASASPPVAGSACNHEWSEETMREPNFHVAFATIRTCRKCGKLQGQDHTSGRIGGPIVDLPNAKVRVEE